MGTFEYLKVDPDGTESKAIVVEHMLYPSEIFQVVCGHRNDVTSVKEVADALEILTKGKPAYYYITTKGKRNRCYPKEEWWPIVMNGV